MPYMTYAEKHLENPTEEWLEELQSEARRIKEIIFCYNAALNNTTDINKVAVLQAKIKREEQSFDLIDNTVEQVMDILWKSIFGNI